MSIKIGYSVHVHNFKILLLSRLIYFSDLAQPGVEMADLR